MPVNEANVLSILDELIRKPETNGADIPRIWQELIDVYNKHYSASPVEEPKKKRRRKGDKPRGWPAGVSRLEFKTWKDYQLGRGNTENVNPQEYKRLRDAGIAETFRNSGETAAKPKAASRKKAK